MKAIKEIPRQRDEARAPARRRAEVRAKKTAPAPEALKGWAESARRSRNKS